MAVVGLAGAPDPSNAGNTLRPSTAAKLVFRLPPSLDADEAANRVKSTLEKDPPQGATVSFDLESPQTGWHAKSLSPKLLASLDRSSKTFFGAPMMTMGTGGTIPFMKMLGDRFPACQFFVTGVLGPHSNAHGPNEFLHIDTGKRVTCCVAEVLADRASQT
jgi:acetylornithine deacetylase/succinyl-diaminopimelate desuccinylase-like protein